MKRLTLITIRANTVSYFHKGQVISPSLYPHVFCDNNAYAKSRGCSWKVVETDYYAGTVTIERLETPVVEGLVAWLPDNGQIYTPESKTWKLAGGPKHLTLASDNWAKVVHEMWQPSERASNDVRPHMPTDREMTLEMLRELRQLRPSIEIGARNVTARALVVDERAYLRSKNYVRATVRTEDVSADDVRGACFESARLLAKLIKEEIDRAPAPVGAPIAIHFTGSPMHLKKSYDDTTQFAAYEAVCDAVCWYMATYFFITPIGEARDA